jgi:membrane protein implicated in regulation of membrane protease activity
MLTVAAIVLAFTVVPSPWGWIAVVGAATFDVVETAVLIRWSKRRRVAVGAETLVGRPGVVVRALMPRGQVRVDGELWDARAEHHLAPGDEVVVTSLDGLVLEVEART